MLIFCDMECSCFLSYKHHMSYEYTCVECIKKKKSAKLDITIKYYGEASGYARFFYLKE